MYNQSIDPTIQKFIRNGDNFCCMETFLLLTAFSVWWEKDIVDENIRKKAAANTLISVRA
jgi:hypothetical protein